MKDSLYQTWRSPSATIQRSSWGGAASGGVRGDLRIMVRASPSGVPHPSSTLQLVELPKERAWPSAGQSAPRVSFGAPSESRCRTLHRRVRERERPGCVAPFGCGDDGHAFPGRQECRAHVESSTAFRSFEAG